MLPETTTVFVSAERSMLAAASYAAASDYAGNALPGSQTIATNIVDLDSDTGWSPMAKHKSLFSDE